MLLTFKRTHASIVSFPDITVPDFTLITGPNGAGKTHLLQAIYEGFIGTDVAPEQTQHNKSEIRLFDWTNMVPQDNGFFSSENIHSERVNLFSTYDMLVKQNGWMEHARDVVRRYSLPIEYISDPRKLFLLDDKLFHNVVNDHSRAHQLKIELTNSLNDLERSILQSLDKNSQMQLREVSKFFAKPIFALEEKEILSPHTPSWGQGDIFQQSFARLFVSYRDLRLANNLAQFRYAKGQSTRFLSDDEFVETHGVAPWTFVNNSLAEAGLDFIINEPNPDDYSRFQPALSKLSSGINIPFSSLSSGEKVLMSFAFCVYYSKDDRQISTKPKILLLDEIDAPLHPSMSKNIIDTITKVLVNSFGIKVIAATHSPSTVALAPEESIFTMKPGESGLHKSTKASALNILTVGVPTIAISYDGRRQVFVESPSDARIYDDLYKLLKTEMRSDRSLEFIATGIRTKGGGDTNTGCDVVRRLVNELTVAGNMSVFGLLDWDGKHNPSERISVIAHERRNGIENVILDPLLLGITICRSFPEARAAVCIPAEMSYFELITGGQDLFQGMIDAVTTKIFGTLPEATSITRYVGGLSLVVDSRCFTTDDHTLEQMIVEAFPFLRAITKNQSGKLIEHVIQNVLSDNPGLIPIEIKAVIEELLERPSHC